LQNTQTQTQNPNTQKIENTQTQTDENVSFFGFWFFRVSELGFDMVFVFFWGF